PARAAVPARPDRRAARELRGAAAEMDDARGQRIRFVRSERGGGRLGDTDGPRRSHLGGGARPPTESCRRSPEPHRMASVPSIKGSALSSVVEDVRALRDSGRIEPDRLEVALEPADLALLDTKLQTALG